MTIEITPQNIILCFSLIGAIIGITAYFAKAVRWMDRQKKQDEEIKALRDKHEADQRYINEELTILTKGVLACLEGLIEKGCNGTVKKTATMIQEHLNEKAHEVQ